MSGAMMAMMATVTITVSINPATATDSGATAGHDFSAATVSVVGGTASAYSWGVQSNVGDGSASVASGGTTDTAVLRVTGLASTQMSDTTFYCDVTVNGQVYRATCHYTYQRF